MLKFKSYIILKISALTQTQISNFDIEHNTLHSIFRLAHNQLNYALGPVIVRQCSPKSSFQWSNLFTNQLNRYETESLLQNEKLTGVHDKVISWLGGTVENPDYVSATDKADNFLMDFEYNKDCEEKRRSSISSTSSGNDSMSSTYSFKDTDDDTDTDNVGNNRLPQLINIVQCLELNSETITKINYLKNEIQLLQMEKFGNKKMIKK